MGMSVVPIVGPASVAGESLRRETACKFTSRAMRVLVYDAIHTGHHLAYVKRLIPAIQELTSDLTVVLSSIAATSDEFRTHLAGFCENIRFDFSAAPAGLGWRDALASSNSLRNAVRRWHPDHVYLPYGDGLSQVLGVRRLLGNDFLQGAQAEALLMRGAFAYPHSSFYSRLKAEAGLSALRAAPWERVHFIDPLIYAEVSRRGGALAERSRIIPDPVERIPETDRSTARRSLAIPEDGRYIGCAGAMDERKGIDLLIDAFASATLSSTDRLLLVGQQSEGIRTRLQRADVLRLVEARRILSIDRYVSNAEFGFAIASMDVVCAPYPRHIGSASIVLHAAAAGKPVLASNWGWMGFVIPQFKLGECINETNSTVFASAVARSLRDAHGFRQGEAAQRFVHFHTVENFQNHWTRLLRGRAGLPPKPLLTWQWAQGA